MPGLPQAQLAHLLKQLITFQNDERLGDVVGLCAATSVINGLDRVNARVQMALAWVFATTLLACSFALLAVIAILPAAEASWLST
jgi:hypothetical protein